MNKPSRSPVLAAVAAFLISSCVSEQPKSADKPVPPVPADVRERGADDVIQWLLDSGYLKPDDLSKFIGDKARQAASGAEITSEGADKNPLLAQLKSGYESLPATAFKVGVKPKWETVAAKLTPDVLAKANRLVAPKIYGVNGSGELLIGDGGIDVPDFTLGQNYFQAHSGAKSQGLSLMREDEYRSFNDGSMEVHTWTWLESGEAPAPALASYGDWYGFVYVGQYDPRGSDGIGGVRRVLRVSCF